MATTYKILGAKNSIIMFNDWITLYTVPTGKQTVISALSITNTNSSEQVSAARVVPASGSLPPVNVIPMNQMTGNSRISFSEGWTLSAGDSIEVDDLTNGIEYILFGSEMDV